MTADRESQERKHGVGGNYRLWKVLDQSASTQQRGAQILLMPGRSPILRRERASASTSAFYLALLFNAVWNAQAGMGGGEHNGWQRMVSIFPEDITNARPSEQLQASLKDMTDCPSMAKFKSHAAAAFCISYEPIPDEMNQK